MITNRTLETNSTMEVHGIEEALNILHAKNINVFSNEPCFPYQIDLQNNVEVEK